MRLSTRIYLLVVLTILAAGVAVAAIGVVIDLPVMLPPFGRFLVAEILASGDDPEALQGTLARVRSNSTAEFTVHDVQDRLIASNADPPHLPLTDSERSRLAVEQEFVRGHPPSAVVAIVQDGAVVGYGQFSLPSLLPLGQRLFLPLCLFLTCLVITSALLARSLARPITHLDNAVHASDTGSPVELRAFQDADRLVFEVSDEGIGIDDADLDEVFRPFFRADRSRTRDTGGTGVGLALSRRIVEAHGGTIAIESERDRGTTVRFSLPMGGDRRLSTVEDVRAKSSPRV